MHSPQLTIFILRQRKKVMMMETEIDDPFESSAFFKNGFNGQGIHLRSEFTENLTSNLSLTRSLNFLDIDLDAIVSETILTDENDEVIAKYKDSIASIT